MKSNIFSYQENIEQVREMLKAYAQTNHSGDRVGFEGLDDIFRIADKSITFVTANPKSGKTTFIDYYVYKAATARGIKTAFFSFETPKEYHWNRMVNLFGNLEDAYQNVVIADMAEIHTIEDLYQSIRVAVNELNCKQIVIDPIINVMRFSQGSDYTFLTKVMADLTALKEDLGIRLIIASHSRRDKEAGAMNLFGSSAFAFGCDGCLTLTKEDSNNGHYYTTIKVDMLRYAEQGEVDGQRTFEVDLGKGTFTVCADDVVNDFSFEDLALQKRNRIDKSRETVKDVSFDLDKNRKRIDQDVFQRKVTIGEPIIADNGTVKGFKSLEKDYTIEKCLNVAKEDNIDKIEKLRKIDKSKNEKEYRDLKGKLPMFQTACTFSGTTAKGENITSYNNIMCIDIDGQDNKDLTVEEIKDKVNSLPFVFYSSLSCGGKGVFCLIEVDGAREDFKPHFKAVEEDFKKVGLKIDTSCSNINRWRFISYDKKPFINMDAVIYTRKIDKKNNNKPKFKKTMEGNFKTNENDKEKARRIVEKAEQEQKEICSNHFISLCVANSLINTFKDNQEEGKSLFRRIKSLDKDGIKEDKLEEDWDNEVNAVEQGKAIMGIGALIHYAKAAGITLK
jgi:hypothetical protein